MKKTTNCAGQSLVEGLMGLFLFISIFSVGALGAKRLWQRSQCMIHAFDDTLRVLQGYPTDLVRSEIRETRDGVEGTRSCEGMQERVFLPFLEPRS